MHGLGGTRESMRERGELEVSKQSLPVNVDPAFTQTVLPPRPRRVSPFQLALFCLYSWLLSCLCRSSHSWQDIAIKELPVSRCREKRHVTREGKPTNVQSPRIPHSVYESRNNIRDERTRNLRTHSECTGSCDQSIYLFSFLPQSGKRNEDARSVIDRHFVNVQLPLRNGRSQTSSCVSASSIEVISVTAAAVN